MKKEQDTQRLDIEDLDDVQGGYAPGAYRQAALLFLKEHMPLKDYEVMAKSRQGRDHPYVAARIFMNEEEWRK